MDSGQTGECHRSFETGRLRHCRHQYRSLHAGSIKDRFISSFEVRTSSRTGPGPQHVDAGS